MIISVRGVKLCGKDVRLGTLVLVRSLKPHLHDAHFGHGTPIF